MLCNPPWYLTQEHMGKWPSVGPFDSTPLGGKLSVGAFLADVFVRGQFWASSSQVKRHASPKDLKNLHLRAVVWPIQAYRESRCYTGRFTSRLFEGAP